MRVQSLRKLATYNFFKRHWKELSSEAKFRGRAHVVPRNGPHSDLDILRSPTLDNAIFHFSNTITPVTSSALVGRSSVCLDTSTAFDNDRKRRPIGLQTPRTGSRPSATSTPTINVKHQVPKASHLLPTRRRVTKQSAQRFVRERHHKECRPKQHAHCARTLPRRRGLPRQRRSRGSIIP